VAENDCIVGITLPLIDYAITLIISIDYALITLTLMITIDITTLPLRHCMASQLRQLSPFRALIFQLQQAFIADTSASYDFR